MLPVGQETRRGCMLSSGIPTAAKGIVFYTGGSGAGGDFVVVVKL